MTARFCPHCGTEVSSDFSFCPVCGTKLPEAAKEADGEKTKNPSERESQQSRDSVGEVSVCPTCGFQNRIDARSCESCGTFLGGSGKERVEKRESAPVPQPAVEKKEPPKKQTSQRQNKRRDAKQPSNQATSTGKKFRLEPYQVASIAAALLLGGILVYGLLSSRPTAAPQGNSDATAQQQQSTTGQPSADVLHEINRLREVVDKNPSDLGSTLKLANMLQDNQFYDQAAVYYKRYLDKESKNVDARVDYGVTLFEGGHTQQGIDQLKEALKINPKQQIGWFNLGIVYLNSGNFDEANVAFKKCVEIDPNSDIGKRAEQTLEQHANIGNQEVK